MKLTEKQKRFCDYYIQTGNATESAKRAGYKGKNLNRIGQENLTKLDIKNYIDERMKVIESERIADAKEVMEYLTKVMRNETVEEVVLACDGGYAKVDKTPAEKDRLKAAELLGKRYRLFVDKVEADVNQTIIFEGEDELED